MSARKIGKVLRDMGPLMLIALLVPGGFVIAWVIYLLRRRYKKSAVRPQPADGRSEGGVVLDARADPGVGTLVRIDG